MYLFLSSLRKGNPEIWDFNHLSNSRSIHIEETDFMDTNSFILLLERFISCRENARFMRSEDGSTLVGAAKELREALKDIDQQVDSRG